MVLESKFAHDLMEEIEERFPGCFIYKLDPNQVQGIPDRLILFRDRWAMLETKRATNAAKQQNQEHYVLRFNNMSYASFVNPDNYLDVIWELERHFLG